MAAVVCSSCGEENAEGSRFCRRCGNTAFIDAPARTISDDRLREETREQVLAAMQDRRSADKQTSTLWAWLPGLVLFPSLGVTLLVLIVTLVADDVSDSIENPFNVFYYVVRNVLGVLFAFLLGAFVFLFIRRINEHLDREQRLRSKLMMYVRTSAKPQSSEGEVIDDLLRMSAYDGQALTYEKKHKEVYWGVGLALLCISSPLLSLMMGLLSDLNNSFSTANVFLFSFFAMWSYLSLVAYVAFLILVASLMRTIYTHEMRWKGFETSITIALRRLNLYPKLTTERSRIRERSFMLYFFLTIITIGLFQIYWIYSLIKDMNTHLENQARFERDLAAVIRG